MEALQKIEDTPEERELQKKLRMLSRLKNRLAENEETLLEFRTELKDFELRYITEVGRFYAELDELEAQIAEEEARLAPDDWIIQQIAEEARCRAAESAKIAEDANDEFCTQKHQPTTTLKKAFRNLARMVHPDLTTDSEERERRHKIMAEANRAYETGDESAIDEILQEWHLSPETVRGGDIGADWIRIIRQISQVQKRLQVLRDERMKLENSENNQLRVKVEIEMREGKSLLRQMAERTKANIKRATRRLSELREVNSAPKTIQVKTKWEDIFAEDGKDAPTENDYGMNVSMFE